MFDNVVVGAPRPPGSRARAVRRAAELARASGGTAHIVTALQEEPVETLLAEFRSLGETALRVQKGPI